MGCCGGGRKIRQAGMIALGFARLVADKAGITTPADFVAGRLEACRACDEHTWLTRVEVAEWLLINGVDVAKKFDCLENIPKLPKESGIGKQQAGMYCRICKCLCAAAARVPEKKCLHPQGSRWVGYRTAEGPEKT
ncbi:MAG: hypothetical protein PHY02_06275 [Phycisphaerae bacterium]|nr:hypothetical protein [Phycisphaerae bacterium]